MNKILVTTTINVPHLLRAYAANARTYGHTDLHIVVVGDRKTPPEAAGLCAEVAKTVPCTYLNVQDQEAFLRPYKALGEHIPYNCIQRRNVGILWAYTQGAQVIITIDDDNFLMGGDFFGMHAQVGQVSPRATYASTSGWLNVCDSLALDDDVAIYHRGYPQTMRWAESKQFVRATLEARRCVVNAGFWLDDPDIDALTRMHRQPVVRGTKAGWPEQFALGKQTWSPFNSQNTALARDVVPAYFLSPFVGRYDDIWASYIVDRLADAHDDAIVFGSPWVRQERNPHDLWRDLDAERLGMRHTDSLCAALRAIPITSHSYHGGFGEIIRALPDAWDLGPKAEPEALLAKERMLTGMGLWHQVMDTLTP